MDVLLNDLSFHGQFQDIPAFKAAMDRVMAMRQVARRFGREIQCHRSLADARVTHAQSLQQAVQALARDESRALMQWIARSGPHWEDMRLHGPADFLEHAGNIVTDTALGEAAFGVFQGQRRSLASLTPSAFARTPLSATWTQDDGTVLTADVHNHWSEATLEAALQEAPPVMASWEDLAGRCRDQCDALSFSEDCFSALRGQPFVEGAAQRVLTLLDVLHRFAGCFDETGQRTPEGQRLYQEHFTGDKAWFSDSSDAEKVDFKSNLTFKDPGTPGKTLFCPWHGKVKSPQIRIHFSWPVNAKEAVHVVYVGPKLTKR